MTATPLRLPAPDEPLPRTYARFREAGPMVPVELPGGIRAWAATTHDAVREVLSGENKTFGKHSSHWRALREGEVPPDWPLLPLVLGEHMLMQDGAEHRRLRRLLSKAFTRARVEALRPGIEEIVGGLLDRVVELSADGAETVDLVPLFSEQVPMAVICDLFGVPADARSRLRDWTQTLFSQAAAPAEILAAQQGLFGYLGELIEDKRRRPLDDLTTALVQAHEDEDRLSSQELVDSLFLLLVAGHETTVHLLGHAIVNLLGHPGQLSLTIADGRWEDVIEETLRLNPPVSGSVFRYALRPVEIAGASIAEGDPVLLCIGGAATDPAQHGPDADVFDITREREAHLAFGYGVHSCLGAPLARLEARVALPALFTRLPAIKPAIPLDEIPYSPSFLTYGPLSIPVLPGTPA